jgi:cell division protein FtsX
MSTPKEEVRKMLDRLPDDSSFEDIQYHIYVREKIERGLKDVAEGRVLSQEDVERRMRSGLGSKMDRSRVEEERGNLQTAVRLFVEEAEKLGTLDDILQEAGYQRNAKGKWESPRIVSTEVMSLAAQG